MFTIVIPVKTKIDCLLKSSVINNVVKQMGIDDQLIIADFGAIENKIQKLPNFDKDSRFVYLKEKKVNESEILNKAICYYSTNEYIIILDPCCVPQDGWLKGFETEIGKNGGLIFGKIDQIIEKNKVKKDVRDPKNITPYHCMMSNMCFPRNEALRVGLFNTSFNSVSGRSHGIVFCAALQNITGCELTYSKKPSVHFLSDKKYKRTLSELDICKQIVVNIGKGDYKYKDLSFVDRPVSIIILCDEISLYKISNLTYGNDEILPIKLYNKEPETNLRGKIEDVILKAKNNLIILLNDKYKDGYSLIEKFRTKIESNKAFISLSDDKDFFYEGKKPSTASIKNDTCFGFDKTLYKEGMIKSKSITVEGTIKNIIKGLNLNLSYVEEGKDMPRIIKSRRKTRFGVKGTHKKVNRINKTKSNKGIFKPGPLPKIIFKNKKPSILFITDVKGWAWDIKSNYLKKYLSDDFRIDIKHIVGNPAERRKINEGNAYDLYFTFGYTYVNKLNRVPFNKRITGVTAHRPFNVINNSMRKACAIHANSILLLNEIKKMHTRTFYLPNGVDETLFTPTDIPLERKNIIMGHIGKLSPRKGQKQFIEPAVKQAGAKYFSHYNNYKTRIPLKDMPDVYKKIDCFVVASEEDGTPCPALEAAACGRPIISNKIGNMPELIIDGYNGFLVEKTVGAYIEKIKWMKDHREEMVEMGKNARKTIEEGWTWKIQAENYRKMFNKILRIDK